MSVNVLQKIILKKVRLVNFEILAITALLCLVFGATLFYFKEVYFNNFVFIHGDLFNYEFTLRAYFWRMLKEGFFSPLFPYNSLSHPLLMNPHHKTLYPTNLLFLLSGDPYRIAHWDYLLHYSIAALGWYLYFKILVQSRVSAFLSALILTFNGVVLGSHYRVEIASFAWVPWTVWSCLKIFEQWNYRKALFTGLFFSLIFLGGNPELCAVTVLLAAFSIFFQTKSVGVLNTIRQMKIHAGIFVLIPVVAVLVMLPILVRAIQDVPLTARPFGFEQEILFLWSEAPTAIFELPGRWLSRFFINSEIFNAPLSVQIIKNWYGNHSIGLFGAICLWFGFASLLKDKKGKLLFCTCILLWCFSMGPYNFLAKWSWTHLEFLQKFRYPGKVFRYFLILSSIPIALGSKALYLWFVKKWNKQRAMIVIVLIAILNVVQVLYEQPNAYISTLSEKLTLPLFAPFKGMESIQKTRISSCRAFLGRGARRVTLDGRSLGIAMFNIGEAVESPVLRSMPCVVSFGSNYYDWIGITHLITPHIANFDSLKTTFPILLDYDRIASNIPVTPESEEDPVESFDVFQLKHAVGPSQALFSEYWYFSDLQQKKKFSVEEPRILHAGVHFKRLLNGYFPVQKSIYLNEEGIASPLNSNLKEKLMMEYGPQGKCAHRDFSQGQLKHFPIQISADLSMAIGGQSECPGLISVPWNAMPGWKAVVNGQQSPILRVGDATLGVLVPQGQWKVELYYDPKYLGLTLLISVFTFMSVLALMLIDVGRACRKQV